MSENAKSKSVIVYSDYKKRGEVEFLWGVKFEWDGKRYTATVSTEDAEAMTIAGRVTTK